MTIISNFRVNTRFTALRQLPEAYNLSLNVSGSYSNGVSDQLIGSASVDVPDGAYIETPLISSTLDGGVNHLSGNAIYIINRISATRSAYITVTLVRSGAAEYQLWARITNSTGQTVTVPSLTINATLRLAIAPFDP